MPVSVVGMNISKTGNYTILITVSNIMNTGSVSCWLDAGTRGIPFSGVNVSLSFSVDFAEDI
ncbi:hypothetical protein ZY50_22555 [Salmonella enterica subsp. enterica]|nr:hypothetical protein [Salmonella enterica subsp. enterica serovar Newport]EAB5694156.1 hypothetical protein [Salmonella enterica subsp. enterica serovar Newport]EBU6996610.1 hypothetical protein [Salmonella enterica subsp. enterica serovar Newport]EEB7956813.1 hypothetical protein [Salmonella enterica subsp. enterica serovar Newport]